MLPVRSRTHVHAGRVRRWLLIGAVVTAMVLVLLTAAVEPALAQPADLPPPTPPATSPEDPVDEPSGLGLFSPSGVIGGLTAQLVAEIHEVINSWFRNLIANALNPTLELLSRSLLATPYLTAADGRAQQLWWTSMVLANTAYVLLIGIGGAIVMTHETVQTRYAVKDIAPRLVLGLLLANASLLLTRWSIQLANALSGAFLTREIDPGWVTKVLADLAIGPLGPGRVFLVLLAGVVLILALALIGTYIVRVALTVLLIVAAPFALACHALPQTEGVARLWWRAFIACLGVQVAQALTLVTTIEVFLAPNPATSVFGLPEVDLVGLVVTVCLLWVLLCIPIWAGRLVFTARPSTVVRLVRSVVVYRGLGRLTGRL